ncbi:hypothetical protein [Cohnella panacarvi]|uniref:hypothetical protein n=1 Tax=Cohnella panacarvi TaxID=400776 RepID=UPI00047CC084|nr:hypothetical protein [Cohnella panacarvi]
MKLYKFTCGADEKIGVFVDDKEANSRRAEVDPTFQYVHTTIEEVRVPGYNITITPIGKKAEPKVEDDKPDQSGGSDPDEFDAMEKPELVEFMKANEIEYKPQWGDKRLREAARAWKAAQQTKTEDGQ